MAQASVAQRTRSELPSSTEARADAVAQWEEFDRAARAHGSDELCDRRACN